MLCCFARTRRSRYGRLPFLSRKKKRSACAGSAGLQTDVFLFFLERKGSKRKSSAEQLLFAAVVFFANMLHKTDGSYVNRPFFRSKRDVRESIFSQLNQLPRNVFCFFSSRKENVPFRRKEIVPLLRNRPPFQASCVMPFALHPEALSATIEEIKPTEDIPCIARIAEPR